MKKTYKLVNVVHIGQKANFEQIIFAKDSLRSAFSVWALDEVPGQGTVARWDFELEA